MVKIPKVVIVGRMNVGKSTLFNRLSDDVKSLTLDYEGVTRDFISDIVDWQGLSFELVDSGGISLKKSQDPLTEKVRNIALSLVEKADVILFVCDGKVGVTAEDRDLATYLHKTGKPVILAVNKIDAHSAQDQLHDFDKLAFKTTLPLSAQHGLGTGELLEEIVTQARRVPLLVDEEKAEFKAVLLGKPNVGKSSLMNILVDAERSLVAPIPGTTREAISDTIRFYSQTIQLTDTPGIRRKRMVDETLELMMVRSSFNAVDSADLVLLMIDGSEGALSDQELKLAFYALESFKALIILVNKSDLMTPLNTEDLKRSLSEYKHLLNRVPLLYISCQDKKNLGKIVPLMETVWKRHSTNFAPAELNELLKSALKKTPIYRRGLELRLYKAMQVATAPITIVLFVNLPDDFGPSQCKFFENVMRRTYDLVGVPIRFLIRKAT